MIYRWVSIGEGMMHFCWAIMYRTGSLSKKLAGFWIIAENQLCDEREFMIHTHFVQHDNLHR